MDKKKIVLCDTGILFDLLRDVPDTIQELDFLGYKRLALSTVTIGETYYGMLKKETRKTKETINKFGIFDIDRSISQKFLDLMLNYPRAIKVPDALIAATAIVEGIELHTFNRKDFNFIEGLKLYNPKVFK